MREEGEMEKLAIDGGRPVRMMPMPARIIFGSKDRQAAMRVIEKTMQANQALDRYGGIEVDTYEREFADFFGMSYGTAVSSGTAAVHAAIAALDLEPGSEIITTPVTDPGTVMPIIFQQCIPVFADVDYNTLNLAPESVSDCITEKTRAIIMVYLAGIPSGIDRIVEIAREKNLTVIEDCSQAHGAKFGGRYVGTLGDISVFSLMSGKHMTSGGQGGMVLTNNEALYWKAKRFADRGKPFNSDETTNIALGLNYRMTELEAAIGRVQLTKLESIRERRANIRKALDEGFKKCLKAFSLAPIPADAEPNPWFCFIRYHREKMRMDKKTVADAINAEGIPVGAHYVVPMYRQHWFANQKTFGSSGLPWTLPVARKIDYTACCPVAEKALNDHMSIMIHEGWQQQEIEDTITAFKKIEEHYLR
jgi:dTDP-4-amino-4,6-dideoxygalactose transaminase